MGADAGVEEPSDGEALAVDEEHAVAHHVGDVEQLAVGREAHILRHAGLRQGKRRDHPQIGHVELDQIAAELAADDGETTVDGKIRVVDAAAFRRAHRLLERHGVRIAEIEPLVLFGHDHGRAAVRREIEVVGVRHVDDGTGLRGARIDRHDEAGAAARRRAARHPQGLQVVRGHDMLRMPPGGETADDAEPRRIDHIHIAAFDVRHVHARQRPRRGGAETAGSRFAVQVLAVDDRRHAGKRRRMERAPSLPDGKGNGDQRRDDGDKEEDAAHGAITHDLPEQRLATELKTPTGYASAAYRFRW